MPRVLGAFLIGSLLTASGSVAAGQLRVHALNGGPATFDPFKVPAGVNVIVFLFTSTECPISNRYAPEVRRLAAAFAPQGVVFRLIYADPAEKDAAVRDHMAAFAYAGTTEALRDPEHALVKFTGATITPEVAVYAHGRIQYRGRIDDRFVDFGVERPAPAHRDLADALAAVVAGKPVAQPSTQAIGCYIADTAR